MDIHDTSCRLLCPLYVSNACTCCFRSNHSIQLSFLPGMWNSLIGWLTSIRPSIPGSTASETTTFAVLSRKSSCVKHDLRFIRVSENLVLRTQLLSFCFVCVKRALSAKAKVAELQPVGKLTKMSIKGHAPCVYRLRLGHSGSTRMFGAGSFFRIESNFAWKWRRVKPN